MGLTGRSPTDEVSVCHLGSGVSASGNAASCRALLLHLREAFLIALQSGANHERELCNAPPLDRSAAQTISFPTHHIQPRPGSLLHLSFSPLSSEQNLQSEAEFKSRCGDAFYLLLVWFLPSSSLGFRWLFNQLKTTENSQSKLAMWKGAASDQSWELGVQDGAEAENRSQVTLSWGKRLKLAMFGFYMRIGKLAVSDV